MRPDKAIKHLLPRVDATLDAVHEALPLSQRLSRDAKSMRDINDDYCLSSHQLAKQFGLYAEAAKALEDKNLLLANALREADRIIDQLNEDTEGNEYSSSAWNNIQEFWAMVKLALGD